MSNFTLRFEDRGRLRNLTVPLGQLAWGVCWIACSAAAAEAQSSSLLHVPGPSRSAPAGPPWTAMPPMDGQFDPAGTPFPAAGLAQQPAVLLDGASWTYQPPPPLRTFQKNDVVTIRVDEITRVMAEGSAQQRKRTLYEAILTDWIRLKDFRLRPDPQANGDPAVTAESNANYRAESTVESRESLTFNIAATVVDVRPNGMLVLEARKAIRVNDNLWETSLSGICRAQDIGPDNVVLSKDLIDLEIRKEDRGHLRDGYSRGWLQRFIDRHGPF
jgi:flagellar L-ring protein precursor FlgH